MKSKIEDTKIRPHALHLIKSGKSRQETFEILRDKFSNSKEVAEVVKNIPSKAARRKYALLNFGMLAILICITIAVFFITGKLLITALYALLCYYVATMQVKHYTWVTIIGFFGIFASIAFVALTVPEEEEIPVKMLSIFGAIFLPLLLLPIWLMRKLAPAPSETKERYTTPKGDRLRVVYRFQDLDDEIDDIEFQ